MQEAMAQFGSPAKRRKTSSALDEAPGAGGLLASKHVQASRLKGRPMKAPAGSSAEHEQQPSTPAKQQQCLQGGEPALDAGLLSMSPKQLAPELMLLNQLLSALYVTLPLVRSRGKPTTYANLRMPVQNFCGRDFQVSHVQQMKALCPEALEWEHVLAVNPSTKRQEQQLVLSLPGSRSSSQQAADTAQLQQLFFQRLQQHQAAAGPKQLRVPLAELPAPAVPSARDCTPSRQRIGASMPSTPQTAPPAAGNEHLLTSPRAKRVATASRAAAGSRDSAALMSPPPARMRGSAKAVQAGGGGSGGSGAGGFTFSPAPHQPGLLLSPRACPPSSHQTPPRAALEDANLPAPGLATPGGASTPSLRPSRLFDTPVATATPQQQSAARPSTHGTPEPGAAPGPGPAAAGVKVRRLTFDAAGPRAAKAPAAAHKAPAAAHKAPAAAPASTRAKAAPTTLRSGITFELGESAMALLQHVATPQVRQEAAARQRRLEQERALDMLPATFEVLRAVYGDRGPCVKPKAEVVALLRQKSTAATGMSPAEAAEQLELMARLVPEFVRMVTAPGASLAALGAAQSVRVNRALAWPAARHKLLAAAAEARSVGLAAAAGALEAERLREAEAAAEAAAAAAAAVAAEAQAQQQAPGGGGSDCASPVASDDASEDGGELTIVRVTVSQAAAATSGAAAAPAPQPGSGSCSSGTASPPKTLRPEVLALLGSGGGSSAGVAAGGGSSLLRTIAPPAAARTPSGGA